MEVQGIRRRATLSDQLSAPVVLELPSSASKITTSSSSPNLRDLLKLRQEEDIHHPQHQTRGRRSTSISLGTFLACEKRELCSSPGLAAVAASAAATVGSRTLLDIIRDEEQSGGGAGSAYDDVVTGSDSGGHRISWMTFREHLRIVSSSASPIGGEAAATEQRPLAQALVAESPLGAASAATAATAGEAQQQQQPPQVRVSLMTLLEETDRQGGGPAFAVSALLEAEADEEEEEEEGEAEKRTLHAKCCVCMVRQKGAAFIPCGHTFCRRCSRELWVSRGSCPLCNGLILEILDIF